MRNMQKVAMGIAIVGSCLLASGTSRAQAPDPLVGTWVLNVAKSTFTPGPAPKSATVSIQPAGAAVKIAIETIGPDGAPTKWGFTTERDGQDVPVTGNPAYDHAASTRESPTAGTTLYKKGGKVVMTVKTAISAEGKILTTTSTGTDPLGRAVNNVAVYERK
jgi:hypothetical protein